MDTTIWVTNVGVTSFVPAFAEWSTVTFSKGEGVVSLHSPTVPNNCFALLLSQGFICKKYIDFVAYCYPPTG